MRSKHQFSNVVVALVVFTAGCLLATGVVAATLLDFSSEPTTGYTAMFVNASGLQTGDTVRIAGVQVGTVGSVRLVGEEAEVSFSADSSQHLTTTTLAEIHYENLLGQRYLALVPGSSPGTVLRPGAVIPTSRTQPALDLTAVFNGFQPLFSALTPDQVNQLTQSIIDVFQGQSGTIENLTAQTAALTDNLAQRQVVIDELVTNLSQLLGTVGTHDQQLGSLIDNFTSMVKGLARQRSQIGASINGLSSFTSQLAQVLSKSQPQINQDISGLAGFSAALAARQQSLNDVIGNFPGFLDTIDKVISSGSYLGVYLCNLTIEAEGQLDISLIPGVSPPQPGDPLTLPSGPVGDQADHTRNCA